MRTARLAGCAALLLFLSPSDFVEAQSGGELQMNGGLSTAVFRTPQGNIQVHLSGDAAPGDTISGVVLAEPAGTTPQEQQANLGTLTGFVVEMEGQQAPVSSRQYEWKVPPTLRVGRAAVTLRSGDGRVVSQVQMPVDPQPPVAVARPTATADEFVLPSEGQSGRPAIIRGRQDGTLRGKTLQVGTATADILASSPRQVVFRVPPSAGGQMPVRFTDNGRTTAGTMRAVGVRLNATTTQLVRGQRASLTTTVSGLSGLTEPMTLAFRNLSPGIVQIEGGEPRVTIQPRDVKPDGTYVETRRLTGTQAGPFQIAATVSRPALSQFDVARTINTVVDGWEVRARFRIATDARDMIQRSVLEARRPLDDFLRRQQLADADPQSVFQALLGHYCYDLRDERLRSVRTAFLPVRQPVMLAMQPQPAAPTEVTTNEVRRWTFTQFLSDLVARASSQSIGYLLVTSAPERAGITIDGQRKSELTNRRFVTSVGTHDVQVARQSKPCRLNVTISALQTSVVACE